MQPKAVRDYLEGVAAWPVEEVGARLQNFNWTYERGDLLHWVPLLDKIDDYLLMYIDIRHDLLVPEPGQKQYAYTDPVHIFSIVPALQATLKILENCTNKHVYSSLDRMAVFLSDPYDGILVEYCLRIVCAVFRRWQGRKGLTETSASLLSRLESMAFPLPREDASLEAWARGHPDIDFSNIKLELSHDSAVSTKRSVIQINRNDLAQKNEFTATKELQEKYDLPVGCLFRVLCAVKHCLASIRGQDASKQALNLRLLAMYAMLLGYRNGFHTIIPEFVRHGLAPSSLMPELVALLKAGSDDETGIALDAQSLALRLIAIQLNEHAPVRTVHIREMFFGEFYSRITAGGPSSLLAILLHRSVASLLKETKSKRENEKEKEGIDEMDASFVPAETKYMDALLSLVASAATNPSSTNPLLEIGIVQALLPILKAPADAASITMVSCSALRVCQILLQLEPMNAVFLEVGGLRVLLNRLNEELGVGAAPVPGDVKQILPYRSRVLQKSLLLVATQAAFKALSMRQFPEEDARDLYSILFTILNDPLKFGGGLFAMAAGRVEFILNNDPLQYRPLDEAGVPSAYIKALVERTIPAHQDAVTAIPAVLNALCLNTGGLAKVEEADALKSLVYIFTEPEYVKTLHGQAASDLGKELEDMIRHTPSLAPRMVSVCLQVLYKICILGRHPSPPSPPSLGSSFLVDSNPESGVNVQKETYLVESVTYCARALEGIFRHANTANAFAQQGGAELMVAIYHLPELPHTFGSTNASNALLSAFRQMVTHSSAQAIQIFKPISTFLNETLERGIELGDKYINHCVPVPELPAEERDGFVRILSRAEGLISLAATVLRMSLGALGEAAAQGRESLILKLGTFDGIVSRLAAFSDEWSLRDAILTQDKQEIEGEAAKEAKSKPKTPEKVTHDIISHVLHACRQFYQAAAKSIHYPAGSSRRSLSDGGLSSSAMPGAMLVGVLIENLRLGGEPEGEGSYFGSTGRYCRYMSNISNEIFNILFDSRRRKVNTLLLNYFVVSGALSTFLSHFKIAWGLLRDLAPLDPESKEAEILQEYRNLRHQGRFKGPPSFLTPEKVGNPQELAYRADVEWTVEGFLMLMTNFSYPLMIMDSPNVSTFLTTSLPPSFENLFEPIPGESKSSGKRCLSSENRSSPPGLVQFMRNIWSALLQVVLPTCWEDVKTLKANPWVVQSVVSVLRNCSENEEKIEALESLSSSRFGSSVRSRRLQVLMDMGFTRTQAQEALRSVGGNMESAVEWLADHPDRSSSQTRQIPSVQDDMLAAATVHSLSVDAAGPSSSSGTCLVSMPRPEILVGQAITLVSAIPSAVFYASDLLISQCSQAHSKGNTAGIVRAFEHHAGKLNGLDDNTALGVAHLIAVTLSQSATLRRAVVESRGSSKESILVGLVINAARGRIDGEIPRLKDAKGKGKMEVSSTEATEFPVPKWVECCVLIALQMAMLHPGLQNGIEAGDTALDTKNEMKPEEETNKDSNAFAALPVLQVAKHWHVNGALSEDQQTQTALLCVDLVCLADGWIRKEEILPKDLSKRQAVESCVLASFQCLARLSKNPAVLDAVAADVAQWLSSGNKKNGLHPALFAQGPAFWDAAMMTFRHIAEDPITLKAAMEAEIKSVYARNKRRPSVSHNGTLPLSVLMREMASAASRNPEVLVQALQSSCDIAKGPTVMVSLKKSIKDKPKSVGGAPVPQSLVNLLDSLISTVMVHDEGDDNSDQALRVDLDIKKRLALSLLGSFVLSYQACIGVVMKRDGELGLLPSVIRMCTETFTGVAPAAIVKNRLQNRGNNSSDANKINSKALDPTFTAASYLLLCVCVRSAEGRRRVVSELVDIISALTKNDKQEKDESKLLGEKEPKKMLGALNLVSSLLSGSTPDRSRSQATPNTQNLRATSAGIVRTMKAGGMVEALANLASYSHVTSILSPGTEFLSLTLSSLDILTRPSVSGTQSPKAKVKLNQNVVLTQHEGQDLQPRQGQQHQEEEARGGGNQAYRSLQQGQPQVGMEGDEGPSSPMEAGPQAVAAVQRALAQSRGGRYGVGMRHYGDDRDERGGLEGRDVGELDADESDMEDEFDDDSEEEIDEDMDGSSSHDDDDDDGDGDADLVEVIGEDGMPYDVIHVEDDSDSDEDEDESDSDSDSDDDNDEDIDSDAGMEDSYHSVEEDGIDGGDGGRGSGEVGDVAMTVEAGGSPGYDDQGERTGVFFYVEEEDEDDDEAEIDDGVEGAQDDEEVEDYYFGEGEGVLAGGGGQGEDEDDEDEDEYAGEEYDDGEGEYEGEEDYYEDEEEMMEEAEEGEGYSLARLLSMRYRYGRRPRLYTRLGFDLEADQHDYHELEDGAWTFLEGGEGDEELPGEFYGDDYLATGPATAGEGDHLRQTTGLAIMGGLGEEGDGAGLVDLGRDEANGNGGFYEVRGLMHRSYNRSFHGIERIFSELLDSASFLRPWRRERERARDGMRRFGDGFVLIDHPLLRRDAVSVGGEATNASPSLYGFSLRPRWGEGLEYRHPGLRRYGDFLESSASLHYLPSAPFTSTNFTLGSSSFDPFRMSLGEGGGRREGWDVDMARRLEDAVQQAARLPDQQSQQQQQQQLQEQQQQQQNQNQALRRAGASSPPVPDRPRQRQRLLSDEEPQGAVSANALVRALGGVMERQGPGEESERGVAAEQGQQMEAVPEAVGASEPAAEVDVMDGIDPEFLAALPPDIRAEVLEQQRRERRLTEAAGTSAPQAQIVPAGPTPQEPADAGDMVALLASFPPDVREEALLTTDLEALPQALRQEALELRNRHNIPQNIHLGMDFAGSDLSLSGRFQLPFARRGGYRSYPARRSGRRSQPNANAGATTGTPAGATAGETTGAASMRDPETTTPLPHRTLPDPAVQLSEAQILGLLHLMRSSNWQEWSPLKKVMANISESSESRNFLITMLLSLLRCPMSREECLGVSLSDRLHIKTVEALKKLGISAMSDDCTFLDRSVARRSMELLGYLCRTQGSRVADGGSVAEAILRTNVPWFGELVQNSGISTGNGDSALNQTDKMDVDLAPESKLDKGKIEVVEIEPLSLKGKSSSSTGDESDGPKGVDVLLDLPNRRACMDTLPLQRASMVTIRSLLASTPIPSIAAPTDVNDGVQGAGPSKTSTGAPGFQLDSINPESVAKLTHLYLEGGLEGDTALIKSVLLRLAVLSPGMAWKVILKQVVEEASGRIAPLALPLLTKLAGMDDLYGQEAMESELGNVGRRFWRSIVLVSEGIRRVGPGAVGKPISRAAFDELAAALKIQGLWGAFNMAADRAEATVVANLSATSAMTSSSASGMHRTEGKGAVLAPGIAHLQPFFESFFMMAQCHGEVHGKDEDNANKIFAPPQATPMPSTSAPPSTMKKKAKDGSLSQREKEKGQEKEEKINVDKTAKSDEESFFRFIDKHRRCVNLLIHHTPKLLLSGPFALMVSWAPRLLDFENKRRYFNSKVRTLPHGLRSIKLSVRRDHVFEDSFYQLRNQVPESLRSKLSVTFHGEEGVDMGGLTREWFQIMSREMFNPGISLFEAVPPGSSTFQPNPNSIVQSDDGTRHEDFFKVVGRVVGKALHDGQLIDAHFTRSFYKHMLGMTLTYEDIEAVDPDFYKNLRWMLENDITDVFGDLTFAEETDYFGQKSIVELCPNGASIRVTNENKEEYVNALARHRMTTAIRTQIDAFLSGFWDVVPRSIVSVFNDHELELVISGLPDVDVDDLRANTEYRGYTASSRVVQWFWEVVGKFEREDRALLLQFVTGTSKVPLGGFAALQGHDGPRKFKIEKAYGTDRLPQAHTCFNQLDLPEYESKEQLTERLLTAMHEGAEGFGFA